MKTYLLDIANRFRRFDEELDVKALLCNKSWQVFNDSGNKEIYIFQEDGSLIISVDGRVTRASWQYLPANHSLIINGHDDQSYMMRPFFQDENLFTLQLDGTHEFSFLIDESQAVNFPIKTLSELELYLKKQLSVLQRQEQLALQQREDEMRKEMQLKQNAEIAAKKMEYSKRRLDFVEKELCRILKDDIAYKKSEKKVRNAGVLLLVISILFGCYALTADWNIIVVIVGLFLLSISFAVFMGFLYRSGEYIASLREKLKAEYDQNYK